MFDIITPLDLVILEWIQEYVHHDILDKVMILLTHIGYAGALWLCIAVVLMLSKKHRRVGVYLLLAIITVIIIGEFGLKNLIARNRPCVDFPILNMLIEKPTSFSFPSGHTSISFAAAFFIGLKYRKLMIYMLIVAGLISFSRLYLYLHYPSDILGGILFGCLIGYLWWKILGLNPLIARD